MTNPTTRDEVLDLLDAHAVAAALGAALELGLFWRLAERPLAIAQVAGELGIPPRRCAYWLQLLESAGLLERSGAGLAPSAATRAAILDSYSRESWALLAEEARDRLLDFCELPSRLIRATSRRASGGEAEDYVAKMSAEPERARRFTRMLYELHRPLAAAVAETLDLAGAARLLDIGGGSGVVSTALLRRNPSLAATVVDLATVCAAGAELAAGQRLGERLTFHPADFLRDPLPTGFDVVLECDVGVYGQALFERLRACLVPGGRLIIVDQLAPAPDLAPPTRVDWALQRSLSDSEFHYPTVEEVEAQIAAGGFRLLPRSSLAPVASGGNWLHLGMVVIEAQA